PGVAQAAVEVLEAAGWRVRVPDAPVCCGLTWISTGQLGVAKRVLRRTVDVLRPYLRAGTRVVGLEPSCTAVFRSDAHELFPADDDVTRLREQTVTLAELLHEHSPGWQPPHLDAHALIQTHCHHHAILGTAADQAVLAAAGVDAEFLDSGCCGLAGNFGFEQGHYEVSEACAERVLLPAVRQAAKTDVILADGFSCRTQVEQSAVEGRTAIHLAELLRAGLHDDTVPARPEGFWATRPRPPGAVTRWLAAGLVAATGLASVAVLARRWTR
ncbi:(Fe-S)-binding protein, partial [Micromonospora fluostatini]